MMLCVNQGLTPRRGRDEVHNIDESETRRSRVEDESTGLPWREGHVRPLCAARRPRTHPGLPVRVVAGGVYPGMPGYRACLYPGTPRLRLGYASS